MTPLHCVIRLRMPLFIFENNFLFLVLNEAQQSQDDKWTSFLEKNDLLDVSFLFKLLVFWSRDFWKRNKLNEDNCASIRYVICSMIMNNTDARTYILKICTQNLISVALNQGNHGWDSWSSKNIICQNRKYLAKSLLCLIY